MANHASHAALPYPIQKARFSLLIPYLDSTGTPTDPTSPDTEISKDDGAAADCTEEVSSPKNSTALLTLTGDEMNCSTAGLAGKGTGPKTTLATLYPRVLAVVTSGATLSAGSSSGGTLTTPLAYDVTGCFVRSMSGTGAAGGSGCQGNQARKIVTYNTSTGAFTVSPNFETALDATTTVDVLLPEGVTLGMLRALNPATPGRTLSVGTDNTAQADVAKQGGTAVQPLYRYVAVGGDGNYIDLPTGANVGDGDRIILDNGSSGIVKTNGVDTAVISPNIRVTLVGNWNKTNAGIGVVAWVWKHGADVPVQVALNSGGFPKVALAALLDYALGLTGNESDHTGVVDIV